MGDGETVCGDKARPNRLGQMVNDLYLQREPIWCERWAQWVAGRRS